MLRAARKLAAAGTLALAFVFACTLLATTASADTLDWSTRPTTNLLTVNDAATVNGVTITSSGATSGTFDTRLIQIQPTNSSNGYTGYIISQMDAATDAGTSIQTTTITFSEPVYDLSFTVFDIDGGPSFNDGTNAWSDLVDFSSDAGLPTSVTAAANVSYNSSTGRASATANANLTDASGDIDVYFAGPVNSITIKHIAGPVPGTSNPTNQYVFIDDLTFTGSRPRLSLQKISLGGTNTFSFSSTNLNSTPGNITTVTPGTAAPTTPTPIKATTVGTAITVTETSLPAGYSLVGVQCTDANSAVTGNTGTFGTSSGSTLTVPAANVVDRADITCVLTNTRAVVRVEKISKGGVGTFSFADNNLSGTVAAITTTVADTAAASSNNPRTVNNLGNFVRLTETPAAGLTLTSATCTDANAALTGNTGSFATLSGNILTIPAANVVAGADFTCTFTNTRTSVRFQKRTLGSTGTFSFALPIGSNLSSAPAAITTTAVNTATPGAPTSINVTTAGVAVNLTETPAAGYVLTGFSCTDANGAFTGNSGSFGSFSGNTVTIAATNVRTGSDLTCVITNSRTPTVKVQKITSGGFGGPFTFAQTNLASAPSGITTTAVNSATPASPTAINVTTTGSAVTLAETLASGYQLTAASCTDANSAITGNTGSIGTLSGTTLTIPAANVVAGADFTCIFTNGKTPTVKLQKITQGGTAGPFTFSQTNLASTPSGITTTAINTAAPVVPTSINISALGTNVTLTETPAVGYQVSSVSCTDANSAVTGNTGSIGTLSGNTLTIPAANVVAGADFTCVFTNRKTPTLTLQKVTAGGSGGPFSFSQTNLASTPANITTAAPATATPASPTAIDVSTIGTAITLTETAASGFEPATASCTDSNSAVTGNSGSIGTLSGSTLTIPAANVVAGASFVCTFNNRLIPTVKLQKITQGAAGGPFSFGQTNLASTPSSITTTAAGTAAPVSPSAIAVTTTGAAVTLTETVASGYQLVSAACTDANSAVTGNTGSIGTLASSTLTIPAANVVAGANFTCVFTNRKTPTVKVQKITSGGIGGPFTFSQTNLASAPSGITTTAPGTAAPVSPTAIEVSSIGTDVTITETVASGFFFSTASCTDANSAITGNTGAIGTLSGSTLTIPASKVVIGADFTCQFSNTLAVPQLSVSKSPSLASVSAAGTAITYTITVSNTGNVTVTAIGLSDALGAVTCLTSGTASIAALAPGASESCSLTYTVTQADLDSNGGGDGDIDNTAAASGSYGAQPVMASGSAAVTLIVTPGLAVTKTADDTTDVTAGQTVTYTYVVTNSGNQTIAGVSLSDSHNAAGPVPLPHLETLTTDSGTLGDSTDATADDGVWTSLAPGDSITFTATYIVKQQDVDTLQ